MTQSLQNHQAAISTMVREDIYKAVLTVVSQKGVGAFTMERVAETAGIAKGSIYNHFKNKDDLLRFVYRRTIDPIKTKVDQAIEQAPSAVEKLRLVIKHWLCGIIENRAMFEFLIHDRLVTRMIDKVPDRARDICIDQASRVFREGMENGEFRTDLPVRVLAEMLFGAAFDVVANQVARQETVDIDQIIQTVGRVFLEGIRPVRQEAEKVSGDF